MPHYNCEHLIHIIRNQKVILDENLATLYGIETKKLNQAVSRNKERFPEDFMFQLTKEEWSILISQIAISNENNTSLQRQKAVTLKSQFVTSNRKRGGRRKLPFAFTEQGVAMPSSVLRSKKAIIVNIEIMRAFIRLHRILESQKELAKIVIEMRSFMLQNSQKTKWEIHQIWRAIEKLMQPFEVKEMPRIGFDLSKK